MKHIANTIRILFLALFLFLLANGKAELWLALFAISLIAALIFGKIYCGYVCPINTLIIPVEWLSNMVLYAMIAQNTPPKNHIMGGGALL